MLRLKSIADTTTVPDKFTYRFPQDGFVATANCKTDWFAAIEKHAKDNSYDLPENWREIAEDALCRRLSGEWCIGGTPNSFVNTRFTLDDFLRGTKVLGSFALSSDEVVDPSEAERRALICSRCPVNVRVPGCSTCSGMANAIAEAKGARGTKYDHLLLACGVCHCSNESQVWVPAEHLAKGVTPEMMQTYREIDETGECWKAAALRQSTSRELTGRTSGSVNEERDSETQST